MDLRRVLLPAALLAALLAACACGDDSGVSASSATSGGVFVTSSSPPTATGSTSDSAGDSDSASSTAGSSSTGADGETTGEACDPSDICCLGPDEIPPHNLLEAFLLEYPPENMPKTLADVSSFEPVANGHMMAWSDENVGGELVDAGNGGVTQANIEAGRDLARKAAEQALPADAVILEVRDEPVVLESLGTPPPCTGLGWAWGSILARMGDTSIREFVYLYIGFCSSGDTEVFFYSNEPFEICAAIP